MEYPKIKEGKELKLESFASSFSKDGRRNEDNFINRSDIGVFAVFDGVGGLEHGAQASKIASEIVVQKLEILANYLKNPDLFYQESTQAQIDHYITDYMEKTIEFAHNKIKNESSGKTTATVVFTWNTPQKKKMYCVGQVGDSAAYVVGSGRKYTGKITKGDDVSRLNVEDQKKLDSMGDTTDFNNLPDYLKTAWKQRNRISQALGKDNITVNITSGELQDGDEMHIVSDGVTDTLTEQEINQVFSSNNNVAEKTNFLTNRAYSISQMDKAKNIRTKKDDITAVGIQTN